MTTIDDLHAAIKQKNKTANKCIFCELGDLTKEHVWSDWMSEFLPDSPAGYVEKRVTLTQKTERVGEPFKRERQGATKTKKLRVVCADCNSGWMSQIENDTKPILLPLIKGDMITLTPGIKKRLAVWITLKLMVLEHNVRENAVFTQADRTDFMSSRKIPEGLKVWLARCGQGGWEAALYRDASIMSLPDTVPADFAKPNIQTVTIGVGQLLIHATVSKVSGLDLEDFVKFGGALRKLLPMDNRNFLWPFQERLVPDAAARLAQSLQEVIKNPKVIWKPAPSE